MAYNLSNQTPRRIGLSRNGNRGAPARYIEVDDSFDDPIDDPDSSPDESRALKATKFIKGGRNTTNATTKKRTATTRKSDEDRDELSAARASSLSEPPSKSRSRQTSVDPDYANRKGSGKGGAGNDDHEPGTLGGVSLGGGGGFLNFSSGSYISALAANKDEGKAREIAMENRRRDDDVYKRRDKDEVPGFNTHMHTTRGWDGDIIKKKRQPNVGYGKRIGQCNSESACCDYC